MKKLHHQIKITASLAAKSKQSVKGMTLTAGLRDKRLNILNHF